MSDLTKKTLCALVDGIKKKDFTSEEVTSAFINNSQKAKKLNTYITRMVRNNKRQITKTANQMAKGLGGMRIVRKGGREITKMARQMVNGFGGMKMVKYPGKIITKMARQMVYGLSGTPMVS